jgi:hypothetical protein
MCLRSLDFGHFHVGINVVHAFMRFQPAILPNDTRLRSRFSEKSPDTVCLLELAKVQVL